MNCVAVPLERLHRASETSHTPPASHPQEVHVADAEEKWQRSPAVEKAQQHQTIAAIEIRSMLRPCCSLITDRLRASFEHQTSSSGDAP